VNGLPLIDTLVLDEADRMIADGHFKELNSILSFIYTKRVEVMRQKKNVKKDIDASTKRSTARVKDLLLSKGKDLDANEFALTKEIQKTNKTYDKTKVVDLNNEEED
jgi:hypothetical protein